MSDMSLHRIKELALKFDCVGPVSEVVPNPCIMNPFVSGGETVVWTVQNFGSYCMVVFHKEDKCFKVLKDKL